MFSILPNDYQYKRVHWQAGMIGQYLYNEAEFHGLRGTALGCYLDESCKKSFNLEKSEYYPILNFTIGIPNPDYNEVVKFEYKNQKDDLLEEIHDSIIKKEKSDKITFFFLQ